MARDKSGHLALKLSAEVLKRNITYDEGLVQAQASNFVAAFIEGLNVLVGHEVFDPNVAQHRLRSGAAERAANGEEKPLELPSELDGWSFDGDSVKPPLEEEYFVPLEVQAEKLAHEIDEIKSHLHLVEKVIEQEQKITNPWIAPAILLVLTVAATAITYLMLETIVGTLAAITVGSIISMSVFQKEVKRYESENRRIHLELRKRSETKAKCLKDLREQKQQIQVLRDKAEEIIKRSESLPEGELQEMCSRYPHLFPSA